MYIVEIILVLLILLFFLTTYKIPPNVNTIMQDVSDRNILYEFSISFINNLTYDNLINNNFDFLSYIPYSVLNYKIQDYEGKIDYYNTIYLNLSSLNNKCVAIFYNFPNIESYNYYQRVGNLTYPDFNLYNNNFIPCTNFSISNDWYYISISNYNYNKTANLSVQLVNMGYIDPYSIFAYNYLLKPIPIYFVNVSYINTRSFNISILNISLEPIPNGTPIILLLRVKKNLSSPNLQYINNGYKFLNKIKKAQIISGGDMNIRKSSWMTIYISKSCLSNYIVLKYSIPPAINPFNITTNQLNKSLCSGDINVYYSNNIYNSLFYGSFPADVKLYSYDQEYKYEAFSILPDGQNIVEFNFYGS